jgi:glycogen(starch) synthase
LNSGGDFDEPLVWSWAVGKFLEKVFSAWKCPKMVGQFHEWLSGGALLYLKDKDIKIATVFTTHATILGRTLAGSDRPLYEILEKIDADAEACNYKIQSKHSIEKASAQQASVFTTVSDITGLEAEHILGRKPDHLLPNGLDFDKLPDLEEIPTKHGFYKAKIKEFLMPYFFPYYSFDLDNTLFYFISGRYEFRNKGLDVFIESLSRLNEKLKKVKGAPTIVSFIFVPADSKAMKLEVVESKSLFEDIQDSVDDHMSDLRRKVIRGIAHGKLPSETKIFDEDFLFEMKKGILSFKKEGTPSISTHELANPKDLIYESLMVRGLDNKKDDKVKVVLYPIYLSSSDGLMDLAYYQAVWGCHLGVFPSYYEPWGYTPLESAAYGVPSITTDLAGFGLYAEKHLKDKHGGAENPGIFVLGRRGRKYEDVVADLTETMFWYATLPKKERIQNKITAEHFAPQLDWKYLIKHYIEAHDMALEKVSDGAT